MQKYLSKTEVIERLKIIRFVKDELIGFLGGWVGSIPDVDVKIAFGGQIYRDALHGVAARKRLEYLGARTEEKQRFNPTEEFADWLANIWNEIRSDAERLFIASIFFREKLHAQIVKQIEWTSFPEDVATKQLLEQIAEEDDLHLAWAKEKMKLYGIENLETLRTQYDAAFNAVGGFTTSKRSLPLFRKTFSFSAQPARPAHFVTIQNADAYEEKAQSFATTEGKKRLIHDLINGEFITVERLGRMLAEFPELPWQMKFEIARQIWDEARHGEALMRRLRELGGEFGDYPLNYWGWEVDVNRSDPLERLAISNTVFEREASKHLHHWIQIANETGDVESARVIEFLLADEVTHVQLGKKWIDECTKHDPERRARVLAYPDEILGTVRPKGIILDEVLHAATKET